MACKVNRAVIRCLCNAICFHQQTSVRPVRKRENQLRATTVGRPRVSESSSEDSVLLGCDAVSSCLNFVFQS